VSERILVIKLAALGDVVQAFGPFAAIRAHHPRAQITLLTTGPYAKLLAGSPWFDAIRADGRPSWGDPRAVYRLGCWMSRQRFARVYDLQTSARSSKYRWFAPGAEWSGIARGASHPHDNPARDEMHTMDRQREQLALAGVTHFPSPELGWLDADVARFALPHRFALLIPGGSAGRPAKRWPHFAALAASLGLPSLVLGTAAEAPLADAIAAAAPQARSLVGQTGFAEIAALARRAAFAVGNDTGPTHLAAAMGCPTLALFGQDSDPALCAPRGAAVAVLRQLPLAGLSVEAVASAAASLGSPARQAQPPPGPSIRTNPPAASSNSSSEPKPA
jgi:ADP-heptose:LPS heptosyltransferase